MKPTSKFVLLLLLLVTNSKELVAQENMLPLMDRDLPRCMRTAKMPKYHQDNVCNRGAQNSADTRHVRVRRHRQLIEDGVYHIPDEQTAYCPEVVENWEIAQYGHDTRIIFENAASGPVVLIFVRNGLEYSAMNARITPPHRDNRTILQPGEYGVVDAFEGHLFYARELQENGEMGRVLVQHQPGLVPIKNRYGRDLNCERPNLPADVVDLARLSVDEQEEVVTKAIKQLGPDPLVEADYELQKIGNLRVARNTDEFLDSSHPTSYEHCNFIYKGFRNTLTGCPINVFNSGNQQPVDGPMTCREDFKFHLGLSPCPEDYMISWESRFKFEPSYIGETWVARLGTNPDIIVDNYTIQPVYIRDCPNFVHDDDDDDDDAMEMNDSEMVNKTASTNTIYYNHQRLNFLRASVLTSIK